MKLEDILTIQKRNGCDQNEIECVQAVYAINPALLQSEFAKMLINDGQCSILTRARRSLSSSNLDRRSNGNSN